MISGALVGALSAVMLGLLSPGDAAVVVALIGLLAGGFGWRTRRSIKQITAAAVNGKGGEPSLIETVEWLRLCAAWNTQAQIELARRVGVHLSEPPEPLVKKDIDSHE